jgi:hypothetical protein
MIAAAIYTITLVLLALVGCTHPETPEQRAKRIVAECRAIVEEMGDIFTVSDHDKKGLLFRCVQERGTTARTNGR